MPRAHSLSQEARPRRWPAVLRAFARFRASLAGALVFGLAYGAAITATVMLTLQLREVGMAGRVAEIIRTFAIGGTLGGAIAWAAAAAVAGHRPATARFAAMLVAATTATAGATAFIYFLKINAHFSEFHEDFATTAWIVQTIFTGASAAFVFAAIGLRMMLPLGLVTLFTAALVFAWRPRG